MATTLYPPTSFDLRGRLGKPHLVTLRNIMVHRHAWTILAFGVTASPLLAVTLPVAVLTGLALSLPLMAFGVFVRDRETLAVVGRFLFMPMYLFSGTYVAVGQLPSVLHPLIYALPLWHGVELCRALTLGTLTTGAVVLHLGYLLVLCIGGAVLARVAYQRALRD